MTCPSNNDDNKADSNARNAAQDAAEGSAPLSALQKTPMASRYRPSAAASQPDPRLPHHNLLGSVTSCDHTAKQKGPTSSTLKTYNEQGTVGQALHVNDTGSLANHKDSQPDKSQSSTRLPPCIIDCDVIGLMRTTAFVPPVTTETLQELDLHWIQNNINLRVDINYDHDLHFMPVSGRRGEAKYQEAGNYWECLALELRVYQHNFSEGCNSCLHQLPSSTSLDPRLPRMFEELRKLLFVLVPERDREEVDLTLDVPLLMQQIRNKALDIARLSQWLFDLLTAHCAPARDEWAEDMALKLSEGAREGDMGFLIAGLEKLFLFCEAMKLDVANHQIRTFRTPLIEDGISFQRDYFETRIQNGKLDVTSSREWFVSVGHRLLQKEEERIMGSEVLVAGLTELCVLPELELPKTLKHDLTRIRQMQEEVQDILHLRICFHVFRYHVRKQFPHDINLSAMYQTLATRIMDLTDGETEEEEPTNDLWLHNTESLAVEITRAMFRLGRSTTEGASANTQQDVRHDLTRAFREESERHQRALEIASDLRTRVSNHVTNFEKLPPLTISEVQKQYQKDRQSHVSIRLMPNLDDISRRIAHICVIHWRVWSDIVYMRAGHCSGNGVHPGSGGAIKLESLGRSQVGNGHSDDTLYDCGMV